MRIAFEKRKLKLELAKLEQEDQNVTPKSRALKLYDNLAFSHNTHRGRSNLTTQKD